MTFQDQIAEDIDEVFLNAEAFEFVEPHMIGGIRGAKASPEVECQVIVDRDLYTQRRLSSKAENITLDGLVFFIKKKEWIEKFKRIPKVGDALKFDGTRYLIDFVDEDMGVLEISIEANRGQ